MNDLNKILISENITVKEAMRIIDLAPIKIALVVDENKQLKGIVTDGDIRRGILKGISTEEKVGKVINHHPVSCSILSSEREIMEVIKSKKIIGLPLVNDQGMVSDFALLEGNKLSFFSVLTNVKAKPISKVLVIGGAGFIGSILTRKLLERGYKVRVLDRFIYGSESLASINNSNLEIVEGDTRHIETLTNCIQDVDAVVHLAELVGDPACALNPKITQDINYLATQLVGSVCKHYQVNRLVYLSSCSVYGASTGEELLDEGSTLNPVSLYAKMKLSSENALREISDENFSPTILRLSTVYGWSYRPRFDLVVNTLTLKAITEGKITIFGGEQWRPNVHVKDVAKAIILVLESPFSKVGNQIFNVGSEELNKTISQLGELVQKEVPTTKIEVENKIVDKRNYRICFQKIRKHINFVPDYDISYGIKEIKTALSTKERLNYDDPKYSNVKHLEKIHGI